jgi:TonB-dependent receptor
MNVWCLFPKYMRTIPGWFGILLVAALLPMQLFAQPSGGIRGVVYDKDFDAPLGLAEVMVAETGQKVQATEEGNYVISGMVPGTYTLMVFKEGYTRKVFADVVVPAGSMSDQDAYLAGEFADMEEFVVQDLDMGGSSEEGLLNLRMETPGLMDAVGADLMSKAGASDAAGALKLVSGATVQDGKYAVVRGLPDRYVVSTLNGVRLPSADPDKRAVQLDQYPASLIESVRVMKSFTPDLQGDASGGAVDVVLHGIPDDRVLKFSLSTSYNDNYGGDAFLSYAGSDNNYFGLRDFDPPQDLGTVAAPTAQSIDAPYGTRETTQPYNYSWSLEAGDRRDVEWFGEPISVGALATFSYEQKSSYCDDEISDEYQLSGGELVPTGVGATDPSSGNEALSSLWDITTGTTEINWSGAFGVGVEHELFKLNALHVFTHNTEDTALLAEDTRGRDTYNSAYSDYVDSSTEETESRSKYYLPYRRSEVTVYTERDTSSDQLSGELTIPIPELDLKVIQFERPVFDFKLSQSSSEMTEQTSILDYYWIPGEAKWAFDDDYDWTSGIDTDDISSYFGSDAAWLNDYTLSDGTVVSPPDLIWDDDMAELLENLFGITELPTSGWYNELFNSDGQTPGTIVGVETNGTYVPVTAGEQLGNYQLVWEKVVETSDQNAFNVQWDFENWTDQKGFLKAGLFQDRVTRKYFQQTLSNKYPGESIIGFDGTWGDSLSELYEANGVTNVYASFADIQYDGVQNIDAYYYMAELPVFDFLTVRGGARYEKFTLQTALDPDDYSTARTITSSGGLGYLTYLDSSDPSAGFVEDADYTRSDILPSIGFDFTPLENVTFQASWAQTVAKQQFKEVVPIIQSDYAGSDSFYGNPDLVASPVDNLDLRLDYTPYAGGLISVSYFTKDITDPIQYYQGADDYGNTYTFVSNYPSAHVQGWEFEVRQDLDQFCEPLAGMSVGANYTMIQGEVDMGDGSTSDVMEMPEYLYNLFWTYDLGIKNTKLGVFYTYQGDTLKTLASDVSTIPAVYALPYGGLNLSMSMNLTDNWALSLKAKNILNPEIQTVYRTDDGQEAVHTSYTDGRSYSVSLKYTF